MIELEAIVTDSPARNTAGWRRVPVLIGCSGLLAALAGIVVAASWPRNSSFYRSATGTLGELRAVQSALQGKYETAQVGVTVRPQSGGGNILCIQLVNPPFLARTKDGDLPAKAREVATAARDALPAAPAYDRYQVILTKQEGVFIRSGTRGIYTFEPKDLPPGRAPRPASP